METRRLMKCIMCGKKIACYDNVGNPIYCNSCMWRQDCTLESLLPGDPKEVCESCFNQEEVL